MVSLFSINIYPSYLIEALVVKSIDLLQGQGEFPTMKKKVLVTPTEISAPAVTALHGEITVPLESLQVNVTVVLFSAFLGMPG